MPRGYRLFFITALAAVVLALALGGILQPPQPRFSGNPGYQEQAASYRAGGANCEPSKIRLLPIALRQRQADTCEEAKEQHRESAGNLIEGRRGTIAAEANAYYSYVQARFAAYGAAIGLMTLFAAVGAAIFAERAAFHTKVGAESYKAREAAELVPTIKQSAHTIEIEAKNLGPTRANIMISNFAIFPDPPPAPFPFFFGGQAQTGVAVEGHGTSYCGKFDIPTTVPTFYCIGGVVYTTVFREIRLMTTAFKFDVAKGRWAISYDVDWSVWEAEVDKKRRQQN